MELNVENQLFDFCQRYVLHTLRDFYNEAPTHMGATHVISKIKQKFQSRIGPKSRKIYRKIFDPKNIPISIPGIQPSYNHKHN